MRQEAEQAAKAHCLVVDADRACCRVRRIEEGHNVIARDGVQVAGRRAETEGQEAPQDALPSRNGLGAQPSVVCSQSPYAWLSSSSEPGAGGKEGEGGAIHAGIDEMLDEPCDASLPRLSRRKFDADLSGVEPAGLYLCTELIDRALAIADGFAA